MDFVEKYTIGDIHTRRMLMLVGVIGNFEVSILILACLLKLRSGYTIILLVAGIIIAASVFEKVNAARKLEFLSLFAINAAILLAVWAIL